MRPFSRLVLLILLVFGASGRPAHAKRGPKILEEADGKYVHLTF